MSTTIPKEKIVLFDIDYTLFDTKLYKESSLTQFAIYEEVIETLELVGEFATIGVFSEGEKDFQITKLIETNVRQFFHDDQLHIFTKKLHSLPEIIAQYQGMQLFFIDDKLEVLKDIKELDSAIFTVWIKRGVYAEAVSEIPGFQPDAEVIDLKKIVGIIHNYN